MADTVKYRRIARAWGLFVQHRLFLSEDHLLAARLVMAREIYRRFYFRDIAAFSIHQTQRRLLTGIITGLVFGLSVALAWMLRPADPLVFAPGTVSWIIVALVSLAWLTANLILGPTCTCFIRTAVQTVELPSLNRMPRALRARAMIQERIASAQADLAAPAVADSGTSGAGSSTAPRPFALHDLPPPNSSLRLADPPGSVRSAVRALGATSLGALAAAICIGYDYLEPSRWATVASAAGTILALAPALAVAVLGRGGRLSGGCQRVAWAVPVTMILTFVAGYVALMAVVTQGALYSPDAPELQNDPFAIVTSLPPGTNTVVDVCYLVIVGLYALIGISAAGLWLSQLPRLRQPGATVTPPPPSAPSAPAAT